MILDGKHISDAERMRLLADIEHEPKPVDPALAMLQEAAIKRFQEVRDDGLHAQSLRLTPAMLRHMSPLERKLLLDFIVQRIQLLEVKAALISRNLACGELEIPAIYREVGAA
jgi:hypothetical protein